MIPRSIDTSLTPDLRALKQEIEAHARQFGLDFFETIFELVDADDLNAIAAYGGFPTRYPHWSFGMAYQELKRSYDYGLSKIYELVINNDPCYAYLMRCNHLVDQKLVMAHVYGHCDFFKNNAYFAHTNRKMMDEMAHHGTRVRGTVERHGENEVERFIDRCKSLENLIDIHAPAIRRRSAPLPDAAGEDEPTPLTRFKSKTYMDDYINPREALRQEARAMQERLEERTRRFPDPPERDVLQFLIAYAPLRPWQRDLLEILRSEAYYFAPQAQTKIMNEGWASYWHSKIMTEKALDPWECIDYADHHSGTMAMSGGRLNPYKIGIELFRDIEARWDTGRFGPDWDACDDREARAAWHRPTRQGRQKIFEVRRVHNDITFIDTFLTPEFCIRHNLFTFAWQESAGNYYITSRDFAQIKRQLLFSLTNFGKPVIEVIDGNYRNRGELLLHHVHSGLDLDEAQAKDTLSNLQSLWSRPVHVHTLVQDQPMLWSFDGSWHTQQSTRDMDSLRG